MSHSLMALSVSTFSDFYALMPTSLLPHRYKLARNAHSFQSQYPSKAMWATTNLFKSVIAQQT
jgi:hypothetical protein